LDRNQGLAICFMSGLGHEETWTTSHETDARKAADQQSPQFESLGTFASTRRNDR
jgi:hypothetical protein